MGKGRQWSTDKGRDGRACSKKFMHLLRPQKHMHQSKPLAASSPFPHSPSQSGELGQMTIISVSSKTKGEQQISHCSSTEKFAQVADICCGDRFPQCAD